MKENKYDNDTFFNKYSQFPRSVEGLNAAGEWHEFQKMLPDFTKKRVLDLGCGFGWHCIYASEHGADHVVGVDISEKMLETAREKTVLPNIEYRRLAIEDIDYAPDSFDIVISSLAFHYVELFRDLCEKVYHTLSVNGDFIFSVEHPIFTANGPQDWYYDEKGIRRHWPVDNYFKEGWRTAVFLGEEVTKYHRTLETYMNNLMQTGFVITGFVEPMPEEKLLYSIPDMADELRRPMMLLVSAKKE